MLKRVMLERINEPFQQTPSINDHAGKRIAKLFDCKQIHNVLDHSIHPP